MESDSISNVSSLSASNCRKKRRSAKLKQCKMDARREQWLSQSAVKNKVCWKEGTNDVESKRTPRGETNRSSENFEATGGGENVSVQHESDSESLPPNSHTSSSLLGGMDSGTSFTNSSSSSSSSSSGGCCSGDITEEEEEEGKKKGDDGCLDDWEAVADALAADEDKHETDPNDNNKETPCLESTARHEPNFQLGSKPECPRMVQRVIGSTKAWRADDTFRPHTLPNLSKQRSFPAADRRFGQGGGVPWVRNSISVPSSCPICYEDLDLTDSSFLPCLCGFRLCLFCHKRILEEDGRCPGCRKPYDHDPVDGEASVQGGSPTFRMLARSCSMIARS